MQHFFHKTVAHNKLFFGIGMCNKGPRLYGVLGEGGGGVRGGWRGGGGGGGGGGGATSEM